MVAKPRNYYCVLLWLNIYLNYTRALYFVQRPPPPETKGVSITSGRGNGKCKSINNISLSKLYQSILCLDKIIIYLLSAFKSFLWEQKKRSQKNNDHFDLWKSFSYNVKYDLFWIVNAIIHIKCIVFNYLLCCPFYRWLGIFDVLSEFFLNLFLFFTGRPQWDFLYSSFVNIVVSAFIWLIFVVLLFNRKVTLIDNCSNIALTTNVSEFNEFSKKYYFYSCHICIFRIFISSQY